MGPIELLVQREPAVARGIHATMQAGYAVEAGILGVTEFVPLLRTEEQIRETTATFFGIADGSGGYAALIEVEDVEEGHAHIGSLVVRPPFFRRGYAGALLVHAGALHPGRRLTVSTGERNAPALALYAKHGYRESRRWTTRDGIPMITLERTLES